PPSAAKRAGALTLARHLPPIRPTHAHRPLRLLGPAGHRTLPPRAYAGGFGGAGGPLFDLGGPRPQRVPRVQGPAPGATALPCRAGQRGAGPRRPAGRRAAADRRAAPADRAGPGRATALRGV